MNWTIDDAAQLLHPPMTPDEIRAMVQLFHIPPAGVRRTHHPGRPATTYPATTLQRAHAIVIRARVDLGKDNAA